MALRPIGKSDSRMHEGSKQAHEFGTARSDSFSRFLGTQVDTVEDGYALTRLAIRPELCNSFGMAHGGAIFALADQALAAASNAGEQKSVAVSITISYVRPVEVGQTILAEARREEKRRVVSPYTITVRTASRVLIAQLQALVYHLSN